MKHGPTKNCYILGHIKANKPICLPWASGGGLLGCIRYFYSIWVGSCSTFTTLHCNMKQSLLLRDRKLFLNCPLHKDMNYIPSALIFLLLLSVIEPSQMLVSVPDVILEQTFLQ